MNKILNFLLYPVRRIREKILLRKQIEQLRKRDPFIYK